MKPIYEISKETIAEIRSYAERVETLAMYPPETRRQLVKAYETAMKSIAEILTGTARLAEKGIPIHPEIIRRDFEFHLRKIKPSKAHEQRIAFSENRGFGICRLCRQTSNKLDANWLCPVCR